MNEAVMCLKMQHIDFYASLKPSSTSIALNGMTSGVKAAPAPSTLLVKRISFSLISHLSSPELIDTEIVTAMKKGGEKYITSSHRFIAAALLIR